MSCAGDPSADICPTQDEIIPQLVALLPRGRAWRTHDGGPPPSSPLWQFFYAIAAVWAAVNAAICALRLEFFCATQTLTTQWWMEQYGLPDPCDPYPDLCAKVEALGDPHCATWAAIAARAGWSVQCLDYSDGCGAQAGCFVPGDMPGMGIRGGYVVLVVSESQSPSLSEPASQPFAGCFMAGQTLDCGPDLTPLMCTLARVLPAHLFVVYEVGP